MGYIPCLAAALALAIPAAALALPSLSANPANKLLSRGIDPIQYDRATRCNGGKIWPGTLATVHWLERNAAGVNWGEYRCEMWGKHEASLHSAGRAIDWHLDVRLELVVLIDRRDHRLRRHAIADANGNVANRSFLWRDDAIELQFDATLTDLGVERGEACFGRLQ